MSFQKHSINSKYSLTSNNNKKQVSPLLHLAFHFQHLQKLVILQYTKTAELFNRRDTFTSTSGVSRLSIPFTSEAGYVGKTPPFQYSQFRTEQQSRQLNSFINKRIAEEKKRCKRFNNQEKQCKDNNCWYHTDSRRCDAHRTRIRGHRISTRRGHVPRGVPVGTRFLLYVRRKYNYNRRRWELELSWFCSLHPLVTSTHRHAPNTQQSNDTAVSDARIMGT